MLIERIQGMSFNDIEDPIVRRIYAILLEYHYLRGLFVGRKKQRHFLYRVITYILTHSGATLQYNMFISYLFP